LGKKRQMQVFKRTWNEWLKDFLLYKKAEGRADTTINDYEYHINLFSRRFPNAWNDFDSLKQAVYQHLAEASDKAAATFNIRREYLHGFFSWLVEEGVLNKNPVTAIQKKKDIGKIRGVDEETHKQLIALQIEKLLLG